MAQTTHEYWQVKPGLRVIGTSTPAPVVEMSTSQLNFGAVATNSTSTKQVLLSNRGDGTLTLSTPSVTGDLAFGTGLTSCGATVQPGQACATEVTFSPTVVADNFIGQLSFPSSASGSPHLVTLLGSAYNPVSLVSATLPTAKVGVLYSPYDFKPLLGVSNETTPDKSLAAWATQGTLPSGMTFDTTTGVLSGTPTTTTSGSGASFTVLATYKSNTGRQVYSIQVGDVVLQVTQIVAGQNHTCAVTTAGAAKCWGGNDYGQLGDGTITQRLAPVTVSGLSSGVASITAGYDYTCAVTTAGAAKCWGRNSYGQLGDSTTTQQLEPVRVSNLSVGVARIAAGYFHTCAVTTAGAAKCWGYNGNGQVGDSTMTQRPAPVVVSGLSSGVASITAGVHHTCVVTTAGAAKCWGFNSYGRLGDGTEITRTSPVAVSGLSSGVASITAGESHTCAVTTAGAAKCWGFNYYGELGDGTTTQRLTPVAVMGLSSGVASIIAGSYHTCAVATAGAAKCWGYNGFGQLGDGTTIQRLTPVAVSGLSSGAASITVGQHHTCAVSSTDAAKCWGRNVYGQLGDGTTTQRLAPVNVKE